VSDNFPLWTPDPAISATSNMVQFMELCAERAGHGFANYEELHAWSISESDAFWRAVWDYFEPIADVDADQPAYIPPKGDALRTMDATWFPGVRFNYAENLLRHRGEAPALVSLREDGVRRELSFADLRAQVEALAQWLTAVGVVPGDRVAAIVPNAPEAVIAMLATTAVGAVWSGCAPEFGVPGILERFSQVKPKVLIGLDSYIYKGKTIDVLDHLADVAADLPGLEQVLVIPYIDQAIDVSDRKGWSRFDVAIAKGRKMGAFTFPRFGFDQPVFIMFSSGTTGLPKCIEHRAGGMLLQQLKENALHYDVKSGDRYFYYTSWAWNMWVWLVTPLGLGATVMLFDGMPLHPEADRLFAFAAAEGVTHFGASPKYYETLRKGDVRPLVDHDLSQVRVMMSTGAPLSATTFKYISTDICPHAPVVSLSGGTEINTAFATGNPLLPVWAGELQCQALGMKVDVFDEDGHSIVGEPGELVCTHPFPSQPLGFRGDASGDVYYNAYFAHFAGVWTHGDWCEMTDHGGLVIHGRSDSVLKPSGVRIGTAEVYRPLESIAEIKDAVVVGHNVDGDQRLVLCVKLHDGATLVATLAKRIRTTLREMETPRHMPWQIFQVAAVPYTRTGKIAEKAVRDALAGREVKNAKSLESPTVLREYAVLAARLADMSAVEGPGA